MTTDRPSKLQPGPEKSGRFTHVLNLLSTLVDQAVGMVETALAFLVANATPPSFRAYDRVIAAMNRLLTLETCLAQPTPAAVASRPPRAKPPQTGRPSRGKQRPETPENIALRISARATRAMHRTLATTSLTEIVVTICRDLGILPNFDDWSAPEPTKPPAPTTTPEHRHPSDAHTPPCFQLAALIPLRLSG